MNKKREKTVAERRVVVYGDCKPVKTAVSARCEMSHASRSSCMLFLQASWATLHVFYPMKIWYSSKWNNQDRPDLIVVKSGKYLFQLENIVASFFCPFSTIA